MHFHVGTFQHFEVDIYTIYVAPEENHGSVVITSISRSLRYIFSL